MYIYVHTYIGMHIYKYFVKVLLEDLKKKPYTRI